MDIGTYARGMAAYNAWMNEKVYGCAAELSDEERRRDLGAFFGSVHATLAHIYVGDEAWVQRLHGEPVTMKSPRDQPFATFDELRAARAAMDARITSWAEALTPEQGTGSFRLFSVTYQKHLTLPAWAAVVQMFNHQTHHRGQVTTLLKQLGKDPGVTDFPWMPYFTDRTGA